MKTLVTASVSAPTARTASSYIPALSHPSEWPDRVRRILFRTGLQQRCIFLLEMEMASRDHNEHQRRNRGQEQYGDSPSAQGDHRGASQSGAPRGQHNHQEGGYGQQSQSDFDHFAGQARGNDFGSDYGSSRYGGPGNSTYGGDGGGQNYQDDRSGWGRQPESHSQSGGQHYQDDRSSGGWGRQQQAFDQGSGGRQAGGYGARNDQSGGGYGHQPSGDRYSEGFYGDASRFSHGGQRENNNQYQSRGTHDPDYQQWRTEQLRNLDNDYENWRADRYKKFSEEFNTWRSSRTEDANKNLQQQQHGDGSATKGKDPS